MAFGHKTPYRDRQRATTVVPAAQGRSSARIATDTRMHVDTVRIWRDRYAAGGPAAVSDRKRSGRPARFTPIKVAELKALACQLPAEAGAPLERWSCPELAREAVTAGIAESISAAAIRRWLAEDALKAWPSGYGRMGVPALRPRPDSSQLCRTPSALCRRRPVRQRPNSPEHCSPPAAHHPSIVMIINDISQLV
jgi:transposase